MSLCVIFSAFLTFSKNSVINCEVYKTYNISNHERTIQYKAVLDFKDKYEEYQM